MEPPGPDKSSSLGARFVAGSPRHSLVSTRMSLFGSRRKRV